MKKDKLITIRVNNQVRDKFNEWCTEQGLSTSEFLSNIIEDCVTGNYEMSSNNKEKSNKIARQRLIALEARLEEISSQMNSFTQMIQQETIPNKSASEQSYFEIVNKVEVLQEQINCISNQIENKLDKHRLDSLIESKINSDLNNLLKTIDTKLDKNELEVFIRNELESTLTDSDLFKKIDSKLDNTIDKNQLETLVKSLITSELNQDTLFKAIDKKIDNKLADLLHEIAKENNIVKPIDICTDEDTLNSPLEQTFENLDIEFAEDERLEVKKDNTDIYVKNLNKYIEVSAIPKGSAAQREVKDEKILTEDERIEMLKQGYSIVFDCHKGKDEKIKQYINFKPEESLSSDRWVYVGTKTDHQWTENSIYGNYTGEKNNKIACEKFAVELRKSKQLQAEALTELRGKALGCWCYPNPCHGQVLADFVNSSITPNNKEENKPVAEDVEEMTPNLVHNGNNKSKTEDKEEVKELTDTQKEVMEKMVNIPAGDKLSENALAKKVGVSRTVLRNFDDWKSLFEIVEKKRGCDYVKL